MSEVDEKIEEMWKELNCSDTIDDIYRNQFKFMQTLILKIDAISSRVQTLEYEITKLLKEVSNGNHIKD